MLEMLEMERLQISLIVLDEISALSFRNLPGSMSIPAALEISVFSIMLKTFSSDIHLI